MNAPPPIPTLGEMVGLKLRLLLESQVIILIHFILCFTNDFLQLDNMYVNCDGLTTNTHHLVEWGLEMQMSRKPEVSSFFLDRKSVV